jgi:pimeloyl-ACP methyl ester carboxylesterase
MARRVKRAGMDAATFHSRRRFAKTPSGEIAYVEAGEGPPAVFLHGVPLNGFHWRHVMRALGDIRRCIAPDLMGLGHTRIASDQDVSFTAQARMVGELCDALDLRTIDLVGNDSGGGIAQLFAARHPARLRTLTLTNCDVHDNWPPEGILPIIEAARSGALTEGARLFLADLEFARSEAGLGVGYADPSVLTQESVRVYIEPLVATPEASENVRRYWLSFDCAQTVAVEPALRRLQVPTLVVWGTADTFFDVRWARWLGKTIPGVREVIEVPGAKLFFPEDRPAALVEPLRRLWTSND